MIMGKESKYYKEIISKIEKFVKKEYLHLVVTGILQTIIITVSAFLFFSILEFIGNFNSSVRTVFIFIIVITFFFSAGNYIVIPLLRYFNIFRKENYFDAAKRVGDFFPSLKDELINSLQLVTESSNKNLYSFNLIDAAFNKVYTKSGGLKFESVVKFDKAKKLSRSAIILIISAVLFVVLIPPIRAASYRLINFNEEFIPPLKFIFKITPGNDEITKGENVFIKAEVIGTKPKNVFISFKKVDESEFQKLEMTPDSLGIFNFQLNSVRKSFKYFAEAENISSKIFEINVIDKPIIKTFELTIIPPSYSGMQKTVQKDNGNITSLVGTKVELGLSSTKNLKEAHLEFNDSSHISLDVNNDLASGNFRIKKDGSYTIVLLDENGNTNSAPITYQVKALFDEFPSIEMIAPNKNVPLANDNRLNLIAKASDDYGFSKLLLNYRLSESKYENPQENFSSIEIPFGKSKEIEINYIWNITPLKLAVDDVVSYYLEVDDNDNVSGPKSAKTPVFTVRVPTLDEVLKNADVVQENTTSELEEVLKESEELKKTMEQLDQELKKDDEKLTWEEKEKVENTLDQFQKLQDKVESIKDKFNEMRQDLQENNLLSEETMEKYLELQKLMDEMTSDEMKKAMEQLQQMLKSMNRDMTEDALQNFKLDEDKFKKSIERTLSLLKRIQVEQKVDELIKRTEQLTEKQNELSEKTSESELNNENNKNELSEKQNEVSDELNKLNEEMKNLDEKMSEIKDMPQEEMQKMMEEFQRQQNQQLSENAQQNIQQTQKPQAMQKQQQLSQNMNQLSQMMKNLQQSIQQQNQMQTFSDMMKILDNLISLSKQQEELKNNTGNLDPNSSQLNDLAEKQNNLSRNLQNIMKQMSDLSQKTFAISPEMGKSLGDAQKQMQGSIQSLQNRNGSFSAIQQSDAMKDINEAAMMMKSSMEAMMQAGGQGGMMSLMQQLQQLSGQQMNLNNMTQMLKQMQQGKLSPQQQGELQRLTQEQDLISKSLGQLNQEAKTSGESKKLPADLDEIMKKMEEVVTDMNTEKLDDNLIQKQERILSKMLDAQKSINERDFEKKRESRSGETVVGKSPGDLNLSSGNSKNKILDELDKAVKEGYTKDYEELIRKYFEELQNEELNN